MATIRDVAKLAGISQAAVSRYLSSDLVPTLDVLDWVTTAHQQASTAEATLAGAVTRARQAGTSWTVIGTQLGISRQGAQQRFTRASTRKADQRQQT